jgi:competence protein ComEC
MFPNCRIDLLGPGPNARNENERSLLARVIYGKTKLLFLGDAESSGDRINQRWTKTYDGVKIPHHGSRGTTERGLPRMVRTIHAVISVGKNRFGHPAPETLSALRAAGAVVHRTDREAALWFVSNGDSLIQIDWKKRESPLAVFLGLNRF